MQPKVQTNDPSVLEANADALVSDEMLASRIAAQGRGSLWMHLRPVFQTCFLNGGAHARRK